MTGVVGAGAVLVSWEPHCVSRVVSKLHHVLCCKGCKVRWFLASQRCLGEINTTSTVPVLKILYFDDHEDIQGCIISHCIIHSNLQVPNTQIMSERELAPSQGRNFTFTAFAAFS